MKNRKKVLLILDALLAVYLVLAFTSFNKPDETATVCKNVNIDIADQTASGFLNSTEVKNRLLSSRLYPIEKPLKYVNTRDIEESLVKTPFVKTVECYKTKGGQVNIILTQRLPMIRVKAVNNEDYYIDDNHQVMPNPKSTSNLIIATGYITKWYAQKYLSIVATTLMNSELWRNQIEQINVRFDRGIELVPRVGNHIVYIGKLPESNYPDEREKEVTDFVNMKMDRLEKFYKYGLSQVGWNKYSYINLEFDNQIICKKRKNINKDLTVNHI